MKDNYELSSFSLENGSLELYAIWARIIKQMTKNKRFNWRFNPQPPSVSNDGAISPLRTIFFRSALSGRLAMAKAFARYATKTNATKPCNNSRNIRVDSAHHDFSCCTRNSLTSIECDAFQEEFERKICYFTSSSIFEKMKNLDWPLYSLFFISNENGFHILTLLLLAPQILLVEKYDREYAAY